MAFLKYPHTFIRLQRQVKEVTSLERMLLEWGRRISEVLKREQARLRNFIRRVEVNRLLTAIDHFSPDAGPAALLRRHLYFSRLCGRGGAISGPGICCPPGGVRMTFAPPHANRL